MRSQINSSLIPVGLLVAALVGTSFYSFSGGEPVLGTEPVSIGTPKRENPVPYVGSFPTISAGFQDWALCEQGDRVESRPGLLGSLNWGPATLGGMSGGCGPCGGGSFDGNPESAALGLQLSPPHDIPAGDIGELPPAPHDHPFVMAGTGEVVYTELDFVIPGIGFDLAWYRTYRSAYEFEGWAGYGWGHCAELYLVQQANLDLKALLGTARATDLYVWDSGTSSWTSPDGYWDQMTTATRGSGHTPTKYANNPYFIKTEKNGVVWEFDEAATSPKKVYVCTKISDPWGNEMIFAYSDSDNYRLEKITDTEGREVTFTYDTSGASVLLEQVTVSNSSIHADYGHVTIDYEYSGNKLTKATKHKTRQVDGGTVVRPYTEYTYLSGGATDKNLNLVKDCGTTVLDFDYTVYGGTRDRCTQVTDADGEVHTYTHENGSSPTYSRYTDPSGQYRDFVHTDSANGDYFINEVKEYLEDEDGDDLGSPVSLLITRDCDCGQITELEYPDGSTEEWTYDVNANVTKYTRTSAGAEADLVKAWTYDTFGSHCRLLTSSGWLRAESSPSAKVTYDYDDSTGMLETVTWPSVTSGQPSSQTIQWEYEFDAYGRLEWVDNPNEDRVEYSYSGDTITTTQDPAGLSRDWVKYRDLMGNVTRTDDPSGSSSAVIATVTPDGRALKIVGANNQEEKYEYDLRGRRTKHSRLLTGSTWTHTSYIVSDGGLTTQTKADDGGLNAISTFAVEEGASNRYSQGLDPDEYGTRSQWGYGSYSLPWKIYNVDDSGGSIVTTLTETIRRDTMGRVTTTVLMGGAEIDYVYDGFGRLVETHEQLPDNKVRKTIRTLKAWGAVDNLEVKQSTNILAKATNYYDEATRLWKIERDDPENALSDLVTTYEKDKVGRISTITDPRGGEWESSWDAAGRIDVTRDPSDNEVQYDYSDANRTHTITRHEYNAATSSFTDYVVVVTKDASGRVITAKNEGSASGNRTTAYEYDKADRQTKMTTPLGAVVDYVYDNLGRQLKMTADVDSSAEADTDYAYSLAGRMMKVTDDQGIETEWTFDSFDRQLTITYAANGSSGIPKTTTNTYDAYGRLYTITAPMGDVTTLTYDDGGRPSRLDFNKVSSGLGGPDRVVYTYDDMNRVLTGKTQQSAGGGSFTDLTSVTRTYDGFGRMDSETQDGSFTVGYTYDEGGMVKEITYPSGSVVEGVRYTMDDLSRASTIERKLSTAVEGISTADWETAATIKYHGYREVERIQAPYDLKRTQTWTSFMEPADLEYKQNSSPYTLLTGLSNIWDADGRIVVRERAHDFDGTYEWGEVFRYDKMGRLTKMWYGTRNPMSFASSDPAEGTNPYGLRKTWGLGSVYERDNVKIKVYNAAEATMNYGVNEHYQVTSGPATMEWNANGQLTDRGSDDFSWTVQGQLAQAAISGETARNYTYDAFGRRVKTVVGSQTSRFLYHRWHLIGEYDSTASKWLWQEVPWNHSQGMLEHIALDTVDIDGDQDEDEYRQYAIHEDYQSSAWGLSDNSADLVERYNYTDPFGASDSEDAASNPLGDYSSQVYFAKRLHGGIVEKISGLYDFRNRWYEPLAGTWTSPDPELVYPIANRYQFNNLNPLVFTDPYGLSPGGIVECTFDGQVYKFVDVESMENIYDFSCPFNMFYYHAYKDCMTGRVITISFDYAKDELIDQWMFPAPTKSVRDVIMNGGGYEMLKLGVERSKCVCYKIAYEQGKCAGKPPFNPLPPTSPVTPRGPAGPSQPGAPVLPGRLPDDFIPKSPTTPGGQAAPSMPPTPGRPGQAPPGGDSLPPMTPGNPGMPVPPPGPSGPSSPSTPSSPSSPSTPSTPSGLIPDYWILWMGPPLFLLPIPVSSSAGLGGIGGGPH